MTSDTCSAIPRSTLLTYSFGCPDRAQHRANDLSPARRAAIDAHLRRCGCCRHVVQRLRGSQQALRTLGLQRARVRDGDSLDRPDGLDSLDSLGGLGGLRGRILGAAQDRAWSELGRRLRALLETGRRIQRHRGRQGAAPLFRDADWIEQRAQISALARRLESLGIHVDLSNLPVARPSAPALPLVLRLLSELLQLVGHDDAEHGQHEPEDYQPSAAPSFLDSLPPL